MLPVVSLKHVRGTQKKTGGKYWHCLDIELVISICWKLMRSGSGWTAHFNDSSCSWMWGVDGPWWLIWVILWWWAECIHEVLVGKYHDRLVSKVIRKGAMRKDHVCVEFADSLVDNGIHINPISGNSTGQMHLCGKRSYTIVVSWVCRPGNLEKSRAWRAGDVRGSRHSWVQMWWLLLVQPGKFTWNLQIT